MSVIGNDKKMDVINRSIYVYTVMLIANAICFYTGHNGWGLQTEISLIRLSRKHRIAGTFTIRYRYQRKSKVLLRGSYISSIRVIFPNMVITDSNTDITYHASDEFDVACTRALYIHIYKVGRTKGLFGTWIASVVDNKNTLYDILDAKYHPPVHRKPWEVDTYFSDQLIDILSLALPAKPILDSSSLDLSEGLFNRVIDNNNYQDRMHLTEFSRHNRKYYNLDERYQSHVVAVVRRRDEMNVLKKGIYNTQRVYHYYNSYTGIWDNPLMYKFHSWDSTIVDWLTIKAMLHERRTRWDKEASKHNGVLYELYMRTMRNINIRWSHQVWRLRQDAEELLDIDLETAFITMRVSIDKLPNMILEYHMEQCRRTVHNLLYFKEVMEWSQEIVYYTLMYGRAKQGARTFAYKEVSDNLEDVIIDTCVDDASMISRIALDKHSTWIYITNGWLYDYEAFSLNVRPYTILGKLYPTHTMHAVSGHTTSVTYSTSEWDYWYDIVSTGKFIPIRNLARLAAREYEKPTGLILLVDQLPSSYGYDQLYTPPLYTVRASLAEQADILSARDDRMIMYIVRNLQHVQSAYNASLISGVKVAKSNNLSRYVYSTGYAYKVGNNPLHDRRIKGSTESNRAIRISDLVNAVNFTLSGISLASKANVNIHTDYNRYMNEVRRRQDKSKAAKRVRRQPVLDVIARMIKERGRQWRRKLEHTLLIEHGFLKKRLNIYRYKKAIVENKDMTVNTNMLKLLKAARRIDKNYKDHWEALPRSKVNPSWRNVRDMRIEAKVKMMRRRLHWSSHEIYQFFFEQEKWEPFILYEDPDSDESREPMYGLYKYHKVVKRRNAYWLGHQTRRYQRQRLDKVRLRGLPMRYLMSIYLGILSIALSYKPLRVHTKYVTIADSTGIEYYPLNVTSYLFNSQYRSINKAIKQLHKKQRRDMISVFRRVRERKRGYKHLFLRLCDPGIVWNYQDTDALYYTYDWYFSTTHYVIYVHKPRAQYADMSVIHIIRGFHSGNYSTSYIIDYTRIHHNKATK